MQFAQILLQGGSVYIMQAGHSIWTIVPHWSNEPKLTILNRREWEEMRYVFGRTNSGVPQVRFRSDAGAPPDDMLWYANARLVSRKVREVLTQFSSAKFEFHRVDIEWNDTIFAYSILNVLTKRDCMDVPRSDCDLLNGQIIRIRRLVLRESFNPDVPIFLLDRCAIQVIALSERVVEALKEANCSGVEFIEIDQFQS